jgi:hypothetical protein
VLTTSESCYRGGFLDDQLEGEGELTFANGDCFEGSFRGGLKQGEGLYSYRLKGESFRGSYLQGAKQGPGVYTFSDGSWEQGQYVNGLKEGQFVCQARDVREAREYAGGRLISQRVLESV